MTNQLDKTMSFSQFGPEFISRVLTPQRIAAQVRAILPKTPIAFKSKEAEGTANVELGNVSRTGVSKNSCDVTFLVPLTLHLDFKVMLPLIEERYVGPASLALRMIVKTFKPAILKINCDEIKADDIKFDAQAIDSWGIAKQLGAPWDLLNRTVRNKIASQINTMLEESASSRLLDLSQMVHQGAYVGEAGGDMTPASKRDDKVPVIPVDHIVRGILKPKTSHTYSVIVGQGEHVAFGTYLNSPEHHVSIHIDFDILTETGRMIESCRHTTNIGGWGGDYSRTFCSFTAPKTGLYHFRLKYVEAEDYAHLGRTDVPVNYIVTQQRTHPELDEPMCFDEFGQQFMTNVVSATVIRKKLEELVAEPEKIDASLLGVHANGLARIHVVSVRSETVSRKLSDRELVYKVVLKVNPDLWITLGLGKEHWLIETTVTLHLHLQAKPPLSIQVVPGGITKKEVKVNSAKCLDGWGAFNLFDVLTGQVVDQLVAKMGDKLKDVQEKSTIEIESEVDKAMKSTKPPAEEPGPDAPILKPGEVPPLKNGQSSGQTLVYGHVPVYFPFALENKQKARFKVRTKLVNSDVENVSIAICDSYKGWLDAHNFVVDSKSANKTFSYEAEATGTYYIRVRFENVSEPQPMASSSVKLEYEVTLL